MTDDEIAEVLKHCSPNSILIVNENNKLQELNCPFKVLVLTNIGKLKQYEIVKVEEVKVTRQLITVFLIKGNHYFYFHFEILEQ
jgi:hypothetical protein